MFSCVYSERRERVLGTSHCIVVWLEEVCPIEALKLWTVFVLHDCSLIVPLGAHCTWTVSLCGWGRKSTSRFCLPILAGQGSRIAAPAWSHPICVSVYLNLYGNGNLIIVSHTRQASLHHYTYGLAVPCYLPVIVLASGPCRSSANCTRCCSWHTKSYLFQGRALCSAVCIHSLCN